MAVEPGDSDFQSKLDEASKKRAKEELGEQNDRDRELAVQSFREWILQQKWLRAPTEFSFLLRFIRARKYSLLLARETFENYWTCKTQWPEWFQNIDPADKTLQEIMRTGVYMCPPNPAENGRRYIFETPSALDLDKVKNKWGMDNVYKTISLICEWINRDENAQVNGLHIFVDYTGITISHATTIWAIDNVRKLVKYYTNSLPSRSKGVHLFNEPIFFDGIFALFKPLMKQKLKDRMLFHGKNLADVYRHIDMSVLPDEYLPDEYEGSRVGSKQQIVECMIQDMMKPEFRNYITELTSPKYGVDLSLKPDAEDTVGSFRKLNVE